MVQIKRSWLKIEIFQAHQSVLLDASVKARLSAGISAAFRAHADIDTESPEGSHVT